MFSVVLGLSFVVAHGSATAGKPAVAAKRAALSYAAMQRFFHAPGAGSYLELHSSTQPARAWPYSQVLWATIEMRRIGKTSAGDVDARVAGLSDYDAGDGYAPIFGGRGKLFYDDNLWIALALDRAADVTRSGAKLAIVRKLFSLAESGWDSDATHPCAGGIFWTSSAANRDRNTVTTANAALLATRLYERSQDPGYLRFARRAYAWVDRCLARDDGLVADHIRDDGSIDRSTWTYNQGAMIATAVHLFRATNNRSYLREAEQRADATLAKLGDPLAAREPPPFLAIFYRDLLELTRLEPTRGDRTAVERFAAEAWNSRRDHNTGLFRFGRASTLIDQAAMVQVYAELAGA